MTNQGPHSKEADQGNIVCCVRPLAETGQSAGEAGLVGDGGSCAGEVIARHCARLAKRGRERRRSEHAECRSR
jgi:hypothetical protein